VKTKEWSKLDYLDPEPILLGLRKIALNLPLSELPYKVSSLRTRELRHYGEGRQGALFCYLIGQVLGLKVTFAESEKSDYDCVAHFEKDSIHHFVPIQLKEFVPEKVDSRTSLQTLINSLTKYTDSKDLVVAVHINRSDTIRLSEITFPPLNIRELWFFGANDPGQVVWTIMGNLLEPNARFHEVRYPGV